MGVCRKETFLIWGFGGKLVAHTCSSHKMPPDLNNFAHVVLLPTKGEHKLLLVIHLHRHVKQPFLIH